MGKENKTADVKPKFLIIDGINNEQHEVESFQQYEDFCNDYVGDYEGIHPDLEMIELYQRVGYPVVIDTGEYASTINGIEAIYEVCFFNELTHQQEVNADLQKRLSEAESAIEGSDIKIYDLKKQNAELVETLPKLLADFLIHTNKIGTIGNGSYIEQAKKFISTRINKQIIEG